jgi:hypothetical protein
MRFLTAVPLAFAALTACRLGAGEGPGTILPSAGHAVIDHVRGEVLLPAVVQYPKGKPCIDEYGERIQAFAGCARAGGADATMAGYFVFLTDVPAEDVHQAMLKLGCKPRVHYSIQEGKKHSGLRPDTRPEDYLQGDSVTLSVFWKQGDGWVERAYQDFVTERVLVDGKPTEKPWTPSFVYHGSGAIHKSGTGCIACPCDCAGGLIADNRFPLYNPKPMVRFDMTKVPKAGTPVYIRLRPLVARN